jgi:hypothetical protein
MVSWCSRPFFSVFPRSTHRLAGVVVLLCTIILLLFMIILFLGYFSSLLDGYFLAFIVVADEQEVGERVV